MDDIVDNLDAGKDINQAGEKHFGPLWQDVKFMIEELGSPELLDALNMNQERLKRESTR